MNRTARDNHLSPIPWLHSGSSFALRGRREVDKSDKTFYGRLFGPACQDWRAKYLLARTAIQVNLQLPPITKTIGIHRAPSANPSLIPCLRPETVKMTEQETAFYQKLAADALVDFE